MATLPLSAEFKTVSSAGRTAATGVSTVKLPSGAGAAGGVCVVRVLHNYVPRGDDELELKTGQLIKVSKKEEDGWWFGENDEGVSGMFPSNFVQELNGPV
jgi:drebrin-like protein